MSVSSLEPGTVQQRLEEDVAVARDRAVGYLHENGTVDLHALVDYLARQGQSQDAIFAALMDLIVSRKATLDAERRLTLLG
jgi:hypothetical protein